MARRCTTRGSTQERGHSGSLLSMKLQDCQEHIDESLEPIKMSKEDFLFYLKIIQPLWKDKKKNISPGYMRGSSQERGPLRHGVTIHALNESKEKATIILSLVREMDTRDLL